MEHWLAAVVAAITGEMKPNFGWVCLCIAYVCVVYTAPLLSVLCLVYMRVFKAWKRPHAIFSSWRQRQQRNVINANITGSHEFTVFVHIVIIRMKCRIVPSFFVGILFYVVGLCCKRRSGITHCILFHTLFIDVYLWVSCVEFSAILTLTFTLNALH